jgi:hypothetical protein
MDGLAMKVEVMEDKKSGQSESGTEKRKWRHR